MRRLVGCLMVLARREVSKDAELLVLRHQNAVLRRQVGRVRYQRADWLCLAALSRLIPAADGRGVRGDPGDSARLAPPTGPPQMGLHESAASRTTTDGCRDRKLVIRIATDNPTWGHRRV
jgi:hypothetical protein